MMTICIMRRTSRFSSKLSVALEYPTVTPYEKAILTTVYKG